MISLSGLNRADVLAALYNASRPQGLGFLHYDPKPMTAETAQELLDGGHSYFDYLQGRVMKVDLSGNELNPWGYDRDNGQGAAEKAIAALRSAGLDAPEIAGAHQSGVLEAAEKARDGMAEGVSETTVDGVHALRFGLADVKEALTPAVNAAVNRVKGT